MARRMESWGERKRSLLKILIQSPPVTEARKRSPADAGSFNKGILNGSREIVPILAFSIIIPDRTRGARRVRSVY